MSTIVTPAAGRPLRFGAFCSGIGAPETAWSRLGWTPQFFSEIEPLPCAVLAHDYPDVPNLGDMTQITNETLSRFHVDVVCAGTPCQSFSIAGLRGGMGDPRGNLALVFLRLVDRLRPRWLVWENVPGVLSSLSHAAPDPCPPPAPLDVECDGQEVETEDEYDSEELHAFNCFVAALSELGYGWSMRVLNAQYFGVPQRRHRVFVVGYLGDWRRAAAVLFERHCLSGNSPPSREAGAGIAASLTRGADSSGKGGYAGRRQEDDYNIVANCVDAHMGGGGPDDNAAQANHLIPSFWDGTQTCQTLDAVLAKGQMMPEKNRFPAVLAPDTAHSLRAGGFDPGEDGTGRGTPLVVAAFDTTQITSDKNFSNPNPGDPCHPLAAGQHPPAIAFQERGRNGVRSIESQEDLAYSLNAPAGGGRRQELNVAAPAMAVRRLTPRECERLQGFPDDHTLIPFRGKPAADGPRYRAIGNSMAVPVLQWIGERINYLEGIR